MTEISTAINEAATEVVAKKIDLKGHQSKVEKGAESADYGEFEEMRSHDWPQGKIWLAGFFRARWPLALSLYFTIVLPGAVLS